jgi:hypothetical protein
MGKIAFGVGLRVERCPSWGKAVYHWPGAELFQTYGICNIAFDAAPAFTMATCTIMATCTMASPIGLHPCTEEPWQVLHLERVPQPPE